MSVSLFTLEDFTITYFILYTNSNKMHRHVCISAFIRDQQLTPLKREYTVRDKSDSLEKHNSGCPVILFCRRNFNVVSDKEKRKWKIKSCYGFRVCPSVLIWKSFVCMFTFTLHHFEEEKNSTYSHRTVS